MKPANPLPVDHSWPLYERERYFALGQVCDGDRFVDTVVATAQEPSRGAPIGRWECNLSDNRLTWSDEVYDIFGIASGSQVTRDAVVALCSEESRAKMELLRGYALRHRRGFTLDVGIRPEGAEQRSVRLIAAPVCEDGEVVRLEGLKFIVGDMPD